MHLVHTLFTTTTSDKILLASKADSQVSSAPNIAVSLASLACLRTFHDVALKTKLVGSAYVVPLLLLW